MNPKDREIAIDNFRKKYGKKADLALNQLAKLNEFVQAINSPIGQELLKDDIMRLEDISSKIWTEEVTKEELAEFRYLKGRVAKVTERLNNYLKQSQEILDGREKKGTERNS